MYLNFLINISLPTGWLHKNWREKVHGTNERWRRIRKQVTLTSKTTSSLLQVTKRQPFSRFIICNFNDKITQCAIDILLGQQVNMATIETFDSIWCNFKTASKMLLQNMDSEQAKLEMMPSYFGHTLTSELVGAEIAYGMGRSVFY